jgi:hypothetical protein
LIHYGVSSTLPPDMSSTVVCLSLLFPGDSSIPFIEEKLIAAVKKIMGQGMRGKVAELGVLEVCGDADKGAAFYLFNRRDEVPSY